MRGVRMKGPKRNGVGPGPCECGCGEMAPVSAKTDRTFGYVKGTPKRFIVGHALRTCPKPVHVRTRHINAGGYAEVGRDREHTLIVEAVLGKKLPRTAQVHHVNGDRADNRYENLVACQDGAYHLLLHRRQRALDACGHANWMRCRYCGCWDDPDNMTVLSTRPRVAYHRPCATVHQRAYKQRRSA